jgi:hypothetical protein
MKPAVTEEELEDVLSDRLSRGTHQVTVRSTDTAGNTGEHQFTWTVNNPSASAPGRQ